MFWPVTTLTSPWCRLGTCGPFGLAELRRVTMELEWRVKVVVVVSPASIATETWATQNRGLPSRRV